MAYAQKKGNRNMETKIMLMLFTVIFMTSSSFSVEGKDGNLWYVLYNLICGFGFLLYPLGRHFFSLNIRKKIKWILLLGYLLSMVLILITKTGWPIIGNALINGVVGGYVYDRMRLVERGKRGMTFATASSGAIILEFLMEWILSGWAENQDPIIVLDLILMAVILLRFYRPVEESDIPEDLKLFREERKRTEKLLFRAVGLAVIVISLLLIGNYMDGYLFREQQTDANAIMHIHLYKLFGIVPVYLIMGWIWDKQKKWKITSVITILTAIQFLLWPVYFSLSSNWAVPFFMEFVSAAVFLSFFNLEYWELASLVRDGEWLSGSGRILDLFMTGIMSWAGFTFGSTLLIQALLVFAVLVLAVLMFCLGEFTVLTTPEPVVLPKESTGSLLTEERIGSFVEHYRLTEREAEVLTRLLSTEETGQQMAEALYISRRVLVKHTSSIYEKTGCTGRVGLLQTFYNYAAFGDDKKDET